MATSSSGFQVPEVLSSRSGTIDRGRDYEIKMAALLALRCIRSSNIQNMWMATNVADCGSFDDIVLHVETAQKKQITYLLQTKHKMNGDNVSMSEFKNLKTGDFSIQKYYNSMIQIRKRIDDQLDIKSDTINHLRKNQQGIIFILYTNRGTTETDFFNGVNKNSKTDQEWVLYKMLNTNNGCVSRFDSTKQGFTCEPECKDLMVRFFLFTKQIHVQKIDAEIRSELIGFLGKIGKDKERLSKHVSSKLIQPYMQFITDWYKGDLGGCYSLTKEQINKVLLANILVPYMRRIPQFHKEFANYSYDIWKKIMLEKSATLIQTDELVNNFVVGYISKEVNSYCDSKGNQNLWEKHPDTLGKFMLRTVKRSKQIEQLEAYEILWKKKEIPLLLNVDTSEELDSLMELLHLFPKIFLTIILTKMPPDLKDNDYLFTSLRNLHNHEVQATILEYPIKLQGRKFTRLSQFLSKSDLSQISVKDVIYILKDEFSIGCKFAPLCELFVDRSLEAVWLKSKVLKNPNNDFDGVLVLKCDPKENLKILQRLEINNSEVFHWGSNSGVEYKSCKIIIINDEAIIEEISKCSALKNKSYHYLILHEGEYLEWIQSFGTVKNIKDFRKLSDLSDYEINFRKPVLERCLNKTTLISACPGMGKTLLLDYIPHNLPTDMWVVRVNLYEYSSSWEDCDCDNAMEYLEYFLNKSLSKDQNNKLIRFVYTKCLESRKIIVLFDGFDEVPVSGQDKVLHMIKMISGANYLIYVTTRPNFKIHLEDELDTFAITIHPFSKTDQITYLNRYFSNGCRDEHLLENTYTFVEKLLDMCKLNLNRQDEEFTGIPLQTMLLAEVFTQDCEDFIHTGNFKCVSFDLVYLFEHFIDKKIKIVCNKFGKSSEDTFYRYKLIRSMYAMTLLFTYEDLKDLNVEQKLNQLMHLIPDFKNDLQKDGIVFVEHGTKVVFVHRTFAEYLTAEWLASNTAGKHENIVKTLIMKIFDPSFETVRNIFDRILAKDCPLHLAIINGQVTTGKQLLISNPEHLSKKDKGHRTILHLIASWGERILARTNGRQKKRNNMRQILKMLPDNRITAAKENVLGFTQLDYALISGNLDMAEEICRTLGNTDECLTLTDTVIDFSKESFELTHLQMVLFKYSLTPLLTNIISRRESKLNEEYQLQNSILQRNDTSSMSYLNKKKGTKKENDGFAPLRIVTRFGHSLIALLSFKGLADANIKDENGRTPLHWATIKGEIDIISELLRNNADVNATDSNGMTSLHYAIIIANISNRDMIVSMLLRDDADITLRDHKYKKNVLHYALHYNEIDIFKYFLEFTVNIGSKRKYSKNGYFITLDYIQQVLYSKDSHGLTLLHWASSKGITEAANLLLFHTVNVNTYDADGMTALHYAARHSHSDLITILLSHNANINARSNSQSTPLFLAVQNENTDTVELLLDQTVHKADINAYDISKRTPLHLAINNDNIDIVKLLLSHADDNVDINAKDTDGQTPLHLAIDHNNIDVVKLLLNHVNDDVDINAKNIYGQAPLYLAVSDNNIDIVKLLLNHADDNVDINAKNTYGRTPLHLAIDNNNTDIVKLLLNHTDDDNVDINAKDIYGQSLLHLATRNDNIDIVKLLLNHADDNVDINAKDTNGRTLLHLAMRNDNTDIVKLLLNHADDNDKINAKNTYGQTSLHSAIINNNIDIVKLLLNHIDDNVDINAKNTYGLTPLHLAVSENNIDIVKLLLNHADDNVDINAKDKYGQTPLHLAVSCHHTNHVEVLLNQTDHNVDINAKDNDGRTPLYLAVKEGNTAIVKLLLGKIDHEVNNKSNNKQKKYK